MEIIANLFVRVEGAVPRSKGTAKAVFYEAQLSFDVRLIESVEGLCGQEQLIKALARERLSTTEEGLSKPMVSAVSGALSTAVGALIPIIPFFFMTGIPAMIVAAIVSLIAHFAVGAAKSLITIRSWWSSGFEMTWIGALEGVVTYIIGMGLGRIGGSR